MFQKIALIASIILAGIFTGSSAFAQAIKMDFESFGNFETVENYYMGQGISFDVNATVLTSVDSGGTGNFTGAPSPKNIMFYLNSNATTLNSTVGFEDAVSFYYSSRVEGMVTVYDNVGTVLASVPLAIQYNAGCETSKTAFCNFTYEKVEFVGVATKVEFRSQSNQTAFDDIVLGL